MENQRAKYYTLQVSALISLYISLASLIIILFSVIDLNFKHAPGYWRVGKIQEDIRLGMAIVLVFFPAYLILNRSTNKLRRTDIKGSSFLPISKLIYSLLVIAGVVMLGAFSSLIMAALQAQLNLEFLFKAMAVFLLAGAVFSYYLLDVRGFWVQNKVKSTQFAIVSAIIVMAVLGCGMANIEMPESIRQREIDLRQISDLETIQWRVKEYYIIHQKLPESLDVLVPTVKKSFEGRPAYRYNLTEKGFNLCATFAQEAHQSADDIRTEMYRANADEDSPIINTYNWTHPSGEFCFERVMKKK